MSDAVGEPATGGAVTRSGVRSRSWGWVLAVTVVVAAVAVASFFVLKHSVDDQNSALLETQAGQVTQLLQSAVAQQAEALVAIDAVAKTGGSTATFAAEAAPFVKQPNVSMALVRDGQMVATAGPALNAGDPLPPALAAAIAEGGPQLSSSGVINVNGHPAVAQIVGGGSSGPAVVMLSTIDPTKASPTANGPYKHINVAVYASPTADPNDLLLTTVLPVPSGGPVADTYLPVGTSKWLVVTAAKEPLAGGSANALPWILLVVGLVLALSLGAVTGLLGRRERYAQTLVAERTKELEASQQELIRRERLSAVGEMATMIGHELRNPLGAALNGLFLIRRELPEDMEPQLEANLTMVENQTGRAANLADDLTAYMRERNPELTEVPFGAVADEVLEATPAPEGVEVTVEGRDAEILADRLQLVQILTNLVSNAYQVLPDGGTVRLVASSNGAMSEIDVDDSGPGIDPTKLERLFDPFFTTRHNGTGLGLAIVRRLAEGHGGTVTVANLPGGGARFVVRLPTAARVAS